MKQSNVIQHPPTDSFLYLAVPAQEQFDKEDKTQQGDMHLRFLPRKLDTIPFANSPTYPRAQVLITRHVAPHVKKAHSRFPFIQACIRRDRRAHVIRHVPLKCLIQTCVPIPIQQDKLWRPQGPSWICSAADYGKYMQIGQDEAQRELRQIQHDLLMSSGQTVEVWLSNPSDCYKLLPSLLQVDQLWRQTNLAFRLLGHKFLVPGLREDSVTKGLRAAWTQAEHRLNISKMPPVRPISSFIQNPRKESPEMYF